jgi:DDE superfamily endonuclease
MRRQDLTTAKTVAKISGGQQHGGRHRHSEFLAFLQLVAKAWPRRQLHVVLDNYGTHTHAAVTAWLARHPRIHLHFTPTSASWMNLVEVFFAIITRQAIRRGSFPSVADLVAAIGCFVDGWNERCQPFVWVKEADDILVKATPSRGVAPSATPADGSATRSR